MKKQSSFHHSNRIHATATPTTQSPAQTPIAPQTKGLHNRSQAAHLDAGSAEPRTRPVGTLHGPYPPGRKQP